MEDFDNSTISTDQGLIQVKPETSRDEQMAFIDTMRGIQGGQNQEIQDTIHALGSDVTPEFGGINGTNSYWLSRYQTPQTESRIATLRTAAQSAALNTALNNYLGRLQEDYNNAYRRANKRERNRALAAAFGGNQPSGSPEGEGEMEKKALGEANYSGAVGWSPANKDQPQGGTIISSQGSTTDGTNYGIQRDDKGNIIWTADPAYSKGNDGYYHLKTGGSGSLAGAGVGGLIGNFLGGPLAGIAGMFLGGS